MKHIRRILALLLTAALLLGTAVFADSPAQAETEDVFAEAQALADAADAAGTEYSGFIVKLRSGVMMQRAAESAEGLERVENAAGTYTAETLEQAAAFADAALIESIEPDYTVYLYDEPLSATVPNDLYYLSYQWNIEALNVQSAWNYGIEGQDLDGERDLNYDEIGDNDPIVVAVIDSGLNPNHEDIDYDRVLEGRNFYGNGESTEDLQGHGTFVTGLIMATKDNGLGIAGICQSVYCMPLRVFGSGNSTQTSTIVSAIEYAAAQRELFDSTGGARGTNVSVINMSLGGPDASSSMQEAVERCIAAGIIVICAAGNDGDQTASYPAQYAIGVGSTDSDGGVSYYSQRLSQANGSNYANKVWVSAPGAKVMSLYYESATSYAQASGTSFSSPEVAALAAVCKGINNSLTHDTFKALLKETAVAKESGLGSVNGQDVGYGWGTVDFGKTIDALIESKEGTSEVTVEIRNEAGSLIEGAHFAIYELAQDGTRGSEVQPRKDGIYELKLYTRYEYEASAPKCDDQSGVFAVLTAKRTFTITLLGRSYTTRFVGWNTADEVLTGLSVEVLNAVGRALTPNADGSYAARNGTYRYTVSAEGYFPVKGSFTINDAEDETLEQGKLVNVLLYGERDVCSLDFTVYGADGGTITDRTDIVLKNAAGEVQTRYTDGLYKLHPDTYTYTAVNTEYETVTGSFVIRGQDKGTSSVRRVYMVDRLYAVGVAVLPLSAKATVRVWNGLGAEQTGTVKNNYTDFYLPNGTYRYEIASTSAVQYITRTGTFTVQGKKLNLDFRMTTGSGTVDDGSSGAAFLTVDSSLYSYAELKKHPTQWTWKENDVEGITLADIVTNFTANIREATSVTIETGDGKSGSIPAARLGGVMLAWTAPGLDDDAHLSLIDRESDTILRNITRVAVSYHEHTETVTVTQEATCTASGSAHYVCTDCGAERDETLPPLGHNYDVTGTCRRCGAKQEVGTTETIDLNGETVRVAELYAYATSATYTMVAYYSNESHTVVGITLRDLAKYFLPDRCVTSFTVTSSYDERSTSYPSSVFDSAMAAWLVDGAPASSYEGDNGLRMAVNNGSSGAWIYSPGTFTATGGEHSWDEGEVTAPTCGKAGFTTYTCTGCGLAKTENEVPATGEHVWDAGLTVREPGCETAGTRIFNCTVCAEMKTESIPALGHSYENGVCTRCGREEEGVELTLRNEAGAETDLTGGRKTGEVAFTVTNATACVVLLSYDGGGTYTALTAERGTEGSYTFRFEPTGSVTVVIALRGDLDLDGRVNSTDAVLAKRIAAGLDTATALQKLLAGTERISALTALRIQRAAIGAYTFLW